MISSALRYLCPTPPRRWFLGVLCMLGHMSLSSASTLQKLLQQSNEAVLRAESIGLKGVFYENRDGGHSTLSLQQWSHLQALPGAAQRGPAQEVRRQVVLGNCSMAAAPLQGGCLPRFYAMDPLGMRFLAAQYHANNLFVYPAHLDYRPGELGDLMPLHSPALMMSRGSSGSDQPLLQALLLALASLPGESRQLLEARGLISPVLSWLVRRSLKQAPHSPQWISPASCTQVLDGNQINLPRLHELAAALRPETLPAVPRLVVLRETPITPTTPGCFDGTVNGHALASTDCCVARVFRGWLDAFDMELQLNATFANAKTAVKWTLQVVNGPADAVEIRLDPLTQRARLRMKWCRPWLDQQGVVSSRLDVAVAADAGMGAGPAAIVSLYLPPQEWRLHDDKGRLLEVWAAAPHFGVGLPDDDEIEPWLRLLFAAAHSHQPRHLRHELLGLVLKESTARQIATIHEPLELERRALEQLRQQGKPAAEIEAAAKALTQHLREALQQPLTPGGPELRQVVHHALHDLADDPLWLERRHEEVMKLAGEGDGLDLLQQEERRMFGLGLIHEGPATRRKSGAKPTSDALQTKRSQIAVEAINRCALAHVVFADILRRPRTVAWCDPRLAPRQDWRDVIERDASSGRIIGWQRHQEGRLQRFDAQGRWIKAASAEPVAVHYQRGVESLQWSAAP